MVQSKILAEYRQIFHYFGEKKEQYPMCEANTLVGCAVFAEQIHGGKVAVVKNDKNKLIKGVDGLITGKPLVLGIRTADCLPIFFFEPERKVIAAIHAGWKGLYKGIINHTVNAMIKLGVNPINIKAAIGPHIQVCCYKVPAERLKKFPMTNSSDRSYLSSGYLNLGKIALVQLAELGIVKSNVEISGICTSCDRNYWSFRRDGAKSGRMLNIIGLL